LKIIWGCVNHPVFRQGLVKVLIDQTTNIGEKVNMFVHVKIYVETLVFRLSTMLFRGSVNSLRGVVNSQLQCEDILTGREEVLNDNLLQSYHLNITSNTSNSFRRKTL
jgi:hypothetical protein